MPRSRPFRHRWLLVGLVVALAAAGVVVLATAAGQPPPLRSTNLLIPVVDGPAHDQRVSLDATAYFPARTPAPAILIAPGFGGTKSSVDAQAQELARRGYVVLAYTPRGFGRSTGQIALNSPDYEIADGRQLIDWLAARPEVTKDGPGDPRVGVTGGSYGGALSLMLAGSDKRVDAIAPVITYNDLSQALVPNAAGAGAPAAGTPAPGAFAPDGVFKRSWAGIFFTAGLTGGGGACGRFVPEVCQAYQQIAATGVASQRTIDLLRRDSPVGVTAHVTVPTLLVQGEQDTLFGLDQADANARQIAAAGGRVKVIWYNGGHDAGEPGQAVRDQVGAWFDHFLRGTGPDPGTAFQYDVQGAFRANGQTSVRTITAPAYPGIAGAVATERQRLTLSGPATQQVLNPPGGNPAAISGLPGVGAGLGPAASRLSADIPGENAAWTTAPQGAQLLVAGSSTVELSVSTAPTGTAPTGTGSGAGAGAASGPAAPGGTASGQPAPGQPAAGGAAAGEQPPARTAVLFAKLYDVGPNGARTLPGSAVAPVRVGPLPADGAPVRVTVTLPGIVQPVQSGHVLRLVVSTTDQSYANEVAPSVLRISLVDGQLSVPVVPGRAGAAALPTGQLLAIGGLLGLILVAALVLAFRRRHGVDIDPEVADVPLVLAGLGKSYGGGVVAVDDLSFRVERGQVVGLLGPNGAGKTTALRMLMGLVRPSAGTIRVFGHRIRPGAPVLSRIGSFVEGAGFLPHLSGTANLRLYWEATGRPARDARFDEALEIAGLGDAVRRRVGTYSQGMRQRLAIAQAMLGLPDLLVLDEPTNGLDPPQIRDMRDVLRRYATGGRTVLVSSHQLTEVEQTCTHVVVMHQGRLVAAGEVEEIVGGGGVTSFRVDDPDRAVGVLRGLPGLADPSEVDTRDGQVHARLNGVPRAAAVDALVRAGVAVDQVGPRGRLEDAFLQLVGGQPT